MALCDQGYLCTVCKEEVKRLDESELYLRFVIGWVNSEDLNRLPERHLHCSPGTAQFIVCKEFSPVTVDGPADKRLLDPEFVKERETLLTAGFQRLRYLQKRRRDMKIDQYPNF